MNITKRVRFPKPGGKLGRDPVDPDKKKRPRNVALSNETVTKLDKICKKLNHSKSALITLLIEQKYSAEFKQQ